MTNIHPSVRVVPAGVNFLAIFGGVARAEARQWNDFFPGTSLRCERLADATSGNWVFASWVEGHTKDELELRKQKVVYEAIGHYFALPQPKVTFLQWFGPLPPFQLFVDPNAAKKWNRKDLPQVNRGLGLKKTLPWSGLAATTLGLLP